MCAKEEREITVSVKLFISKQFVRNDKGTIRLKKNTTVHDLINIIRKEYMTRSRYYEKNIGWVDVFRGNVLLKNGSVIGYFDNDGFKWSNDAEMGLQNEDELVILSPLDGG